MPGKSALLDSSSESNEFNPVDNTTMEQLAQAFSADIGLTQPSLVRSLTKAPSFDVSKMLVGAVSPAK